jgi:hypothetical protein
MNTSPSSPSSATPRRLQIARELLESAPVARNSPTIRSALLKAGGPDYQRLLTYGFWCTGELLVLEAAAAIAGVPIDGDVLQLDMDRLWYRLDGENFAAVAQAAAKL